MSTVIFKQKDHNNIWQEENGKFTVHALEAMTAEEATSLAVALSTAAFPHLKRSLPLAVRLRDEEGPRLPQMIAQQRERLRHQDDSGDACQCPACVHSMG